MAACLAEHCVAAQNLYWCPYSRRQAGDHLYPDLEPLAIRSDLLSALYTVLAPQNRESAQEHGSPLQPQLPAPRPASSESAARARQGRPASV